MTSSDTENALKTLREHYDSATLEAQMLYASKTVMPHLIGPLPTQMGISGETSTPVKLLDNACGSGVLTHAVQQALPKHILEKSSFLCADASDGMVSVAKKRLGTEGWVNTEVKKLDATNTGLPENSFTHVGLDTKRILKSGGIFGATTFHKENTFWLPDIRTAFESFPFEAKLPEVMKMQMHDQGDWTNPAWIEEHLKKEGFQDVKVTAHDDSYTIESAEDYILQFGMMLGWLIKTWWSEEVQREHSLEEVKELLRDHLVEKYEGKGWDIEFKVICMTGRVE
ncbi:hypothetical protein FGADI_11224 [Fusarium gaditjirri]|uniref:Methyltransferase domain-containing protein n=1 Tax=Fusarium gaditjirri TaxID=282569 RepID=A0A8H4WQT2_9HYPO|nr:hypothetical protein FGADI_11224 [Fusarium gaditjirri]